MHRGTLDSEGALHEIFRDVHRLTLRPHSQIGEEEGQLPKGIWELPFKCSSRRRVSRIACQLGVTNQLFLKMDPYDEPTTLTISRACLSHWGSADFDFKFLSELGTKPWELPLDEMCSERGQIDDDWPRFSDLKFTSKLRPVVEGSFRVRFKAEQPTSCSNVSFPFDVDGHLYFTLNLKTGLLTIERPQDASDWGH